MIKIYAALLAAAALFGTQAAHAAVPETPAPTAPAGARASAIPAPGAGQPASYEDQIRAFLQEQAAAYTGTPQIAVEPVDTERLAPCEQAEVFLRPGSRLSSRLTVGLRCLAPQTWVTYAQANLSIDGSYYVSARPLKAGTVITRDDLSERSGDLLLLPRGVLRDADRLIGSITTQRINAGSAIKARALRSAGSIQRGQAVRLEARGTGFVATSEGKAMQSGEPGTQIQVRAGSGHMVTGTVLNAHTVLVLM